MENKRQTYSSGRKDDLIQLDDRSQPVLSQNVVTKKPKLATNEKDNETTSVNKGNVFHYIPSVWISFPF